MRPTIGIYKNHIFPNLNDRPLESYGEDDVAAIIKYFENTKGFSEPFIAHIRMLIRIVFEQAEKDGIVDYTLWGNDILLPEMERQEILEKADNGVRPKSLTIGQQILIFKELTKDCMQSGAKMGLLLMFICGLRNSEACGITFRDVYKVPGIDGCYRLITHNTVDKNHEMDGQGKTKNAPRAVYLTKYAFELIKKREAILTEMVENGKLVLDESRGYKSVEDLPIACTKDFNVPCNSRQLSNAGKKLLMQVKYDEKEFYLAEIVEKREVNEKDPTAYLLRRNFCTDLLRVNMPQSAVEYFMGHAILDISVDPRDFVSTDLCADIFQVMILRPIMNLYVDDTTKSICLQEQTMTEERWNEISKRNWHLRFPPYVQAPEMYMREFRRVLCEIPWSEKSPEICRKKI